MIASTPCCWFGREPSIIRRRQAATTVSKQVSVGAAKGRTAAELQNPDDERTVAGAYDG